MHVKIQFIIVALLMVVQSQIVAGSEFNPENMTTVRHGIETKSPSVVSLDGAPWVVAADPKNIGRVEKWWEAPRADAKPIRVPGIMQEALPAYHGVAWYWLDLTPKPNPNPGGRYLLRFWMVDYLADVWLNGVHVGTHEGGEEMFVLDVTDAVKPNTVNRLAVRVLNPTREPIDGIALAQTPHRNKGYPFGVGYDYNYGGIVDSVELLCVPAVWIENLYVVPDCKSGEIRIMVNVRNASKRALNGRLDFTVAPAHDGETLDAATVQKTLPPGDTLVEATVKVENPRLWNLNDPNLYRVTARTTVGNSGSYDETSTRCGFREFSLQDGYFRLNGKRVFIKCSHSGNVAPVGARVPLDPDLLRRDLLNSKVMGFNMIRFFCAIPRRYQLDLCDEIGLMVYEESFAGWCLENSLQLSERFDTAIRGMIRRDRNHPSVVIWGLLNENFGDAAFQYAAVSLPMIRAFDNHRVVLLNSGREDRYQWTDPCWGPGYGGFGRLPAVWNTRPSFEPNVTYNGTQEPVKLADTTWATGQLALHPGPWGQYSVLQWTAPEAGQYAISADFSGICATGTTSDVHVFKNADSLYDGFLNLNGSPNNAKFEKTETLAKGDKLSVVVGIGNGVPNSDTTALVLKIQSPQGKVFDAAADFSTKSNPNGPWLYGWLPAGEKPNLAALKLYADSDTQPPKPIGAISNPGSAEWQDILSDHHTYRHSPHTAEDIRTLRERNPHRALFISEYGIGSGVNMVRLLRHYEQIGHPHSEDAEVYRDMLKRFMADWDAWRMGEVFANPDDYLQQCIAKMAPLRKQGLNAIRANVDCVGYSMTGTYDHALTGEGATATEFRDLKPGATDALFDGFAPLRFCLFIEPVHFYRGTKTHLKAVLANEDAMLPGQYPVRLQIVGPNNEPVFDKTVTVTINDKSVKPEQPFAIPFFDEDVVIDGPSGKYRFLASFERGGAAFGGDVAFYVADPAELPKVDAEIVRWGDDPGLDDWLNRSGVKFRPFAADNQSSREVILVGEKPATGDAAAWRPLVEHIARGSTVLFLCPEVFRKGDDPVGWVPLEKKGKFVVQSDWLYPNDHWLRPHPIFDSLPTGGIMDYTYFREFISDGRWQELAPPSLTVSASTYSAGGYGGSTLMTVHDLAAGRLLLNAFSIRQNLGTPVCDRVLRNMMRWASADTSKPPAELPSDFEQKLKSIGYMEQ